MAQAFLGDEDEGSSLQGEAKRKKSNAAKIE